MPGLPFPEPRPPPSGRNNPHNHQIGPLDAALPFAHQRENAYLSGAYFKDVPTRTTTAPGR
jgi:hypothetical protein